MHAGAGGDSTESVYAGQRAAVRGSAKPSELPTHPGVDRLRRLDHGFGHQLDYASLGASEQKSTVAVRIQLMPQAPREHCAGQALQKNAVALSLDVAGVGAGFLPGGDAVVALAGMGVSTAGGIYSITQNDTTGVALNTASFGLSALTPTAEAIGGGVAKAVPGLGAAVSVFGFLDDAYQAYHDYQACMAGGQ